MMSEITREYIAGILCAMQVIGDDEASAAIEQFIVQLEEENEALRKKAKKEMLRAIAAEFDLNKPPTERTYCVGCALPSENDALKRENEAWCNGLNVYATPWGCWTFAYVGVISDGYETKADAIAAALLTAEEQDDA